MDPGIACTIVAVSGGYPGSYEKGYPISGLEEPLTSDSLIFHAGTKERDGQIVANGGRVLNVCAIGRTVAEAQKQAYAAVDKIQWPDGFCRRDIGKRAVERGA